MIVMRLKFDLILKAFIPVFYLTKTMNTTIPFYAAKFNVPILLHQQKSQKESDRSEIKRKSQKEPDVIKKGMLYTCSPRIYSNKIKQTVLGHKKKKVCLRHPHALLCELHFACRATRWPLKNFFFFNNFFYYFFLLSSHPSKLVLEQMRGKLDFEEFGITINRWNF